MGDALPCWSRALGRRYPCIAQSWLGRTCALCALCYLSLLVTTYTLSQAPRQRYIMDLRSSGFACDALRVA
eukprot:3300283-Lingulodinium_polyedra.AAC.1